MNSNANPNLDTREKEIESLLYERIKETVREFGNERWFKIRPDIFAIQYLDQYLLYSPLQGLGAVITSAGLCSLLLNNKSLISDCLSKCPNSSDLELLKLFDTKPKHSPEIISQKVSEFRPYSVMLSPTSNCQLACTYCYIRGGDKPRNMSSDIAKAAIDFTVKNALDRGMSYYSLGFHGQGEPTLNWKLFKEAVIYAIEKCRINNFIPTFSVVSNGILNEEKINFLRKYKFNITLSCDGLKRVMDIQRPLRNGKSSFDEIIRTMNSFDEKGIVYSIRSTITDLNIDEMSDFVTFLNERTSCKQVFFEPVFDLGRAKDNKINNSFVLSKFVKNFLEAQKLGSKININVDYSSCKISGLRSSYCGAYGSELTFVVSAEGNVSSCFQVLDLSDPRSKTFIYGRYDENSRSFKFKNRILEKLLSLNVSKIKYCEECFIKWNCGGGCLSKSVFEGISALNSTESKENCKIHYGIIKHELLKSIIKDTEIDLFREYKYY